MTSVSSLFSAPSGSQATALRLLKNGKGEDGSLSDKTGNAVTRDPFEDLFATELGQEEAGEDDTGYKPVAAPLRTATGAIVEPLTNEGGAFDTNGNPLPVAYTIKWHGVEVARIWNSGAAEISNGFDLSSLGWDTGETPDDEKGADGKELFGMALAQKRFEKLSVYFDAQA